MIFFSIVTLVSNDEREVKYTGRSLAVQRDAPEFEWIVCGKLPDALHEEFAPLKPILMHHDLNAGLAKASGEYVWILPAGTCLSDSLVLQEAKKDIIASFMPDLFYGASREDGHITRVPNIAAFSRHLAAPLAAIAIRRRSLSEEHIDAQYQHEAAYEFVLRFINRITKIGLTERILADVLGVPMTEDALKEAGQERFAIRAKLLGQNTFKNKIIASLQMTAARLKHRAPKTYWKIRGTIAPVKYERPPPLTRGGYKGIFFKRR